MFQRSLTQTILKNFKPGFITVIYGPRRVGKTVLLDQIVSKLPNEKILRLNGDTQEARDALSTTSETKLTNLVKEKTVIIIDEAQRIKDISLALKILVDKFPQKKIIVTGSSSLMLTKGLQETLTGRTIKFKLYPLSTHELTVGKDAHEKPFFLEDQLIFGGYPYITQVIASSEKQLYLKSIVSDYLFKDILFLKNISSPDTLKKLATLLAFQVGSEVSLNELARNLMIDIKTVIRYISLLKQSFVIFELSAFSKNSRKEVAKSKKYFFWDLGIRNALTEQFMPLSVRPDIGGLWENFLAVERIKKHQYLQKDYQYFFWRTYEGAEIDWIEQSALGLKAFEFKWRPKKLHTPKAFSDLYKTNTQLISKDNYLKFVEYKQS